MNYLSIYNSIITNAIQSNRRRKSIKDKSYVYYESHHIIPKCLGGSNDKENLVLLTAKEHFVAHQLLVKIYPKEHKLVFALRMMCASSTKHIRNNKEYKWIKEKVAASSSASQKGRSYGYKFPKEHSLSVGEKNGMYGKNHTEHTKKIQSTKAKDRDPSTYDSARLPKSESYKKNMREIKQTKRYKLISPGGKEYIFDRCSDASDFSGVSVAALIKLAGNCYKFDHCKNWKCTILPL